MEHELADEKPQPAPRRRRSRRGLIAGVLAVAVIGVVFVYVLPKIASYGQVWDVAGRMSGSWVLVLIGAAILNLFSNVPPWMAALPGLGFVNATRVAFASSAVSVIAPGGVAVGVTAQYKMLRSWGLRAGAVALATTLTNLLGQLVTFGFPILAIGALSAQGGHNGSLDVVAVVGLLIFVAIAAAVAVGLSSRRTAISLGDRVAAATNRAKGLFHREPVRWGGHEFGNFRDEAVWLLRRRWLPLTVAMIASQLAVFLVLVLTLQAVGVSSTQVTLAEAFASWSLIRALGKIPITPGGFGVEEIALTGALIGFGAHDKQAVTATLIYRFLTVAPSLAAGLLAAATYRIGRQSSV